ncbi:MAG TPA: ABC transporter permease [Bryobacteraceae bacterium]
MLQDIRYALRMLRQNRGFAAVAILSLALGIGANTAIFTLVDTVILRSLPVRDPESLAVLAINPDKPSTSFNYPDYEYIRDHNKSFSGVVAYSGGGRQTALRVSDEGANAASELVACTMVSGNYFQVLGVGSAAGRLFTPEDNKAEGAHPYAILSYDFWQRRFGGDPHAVGRAVTINGSPFNIIGVTQAGFTDANVGVSPEVFVPIMMMRAVNRSVRQWNNRHFWWLNVMGRLKPGVTLQAATPEVDVLWKQIQANDPEQRNRKAPAYDKDAEKRNRGTLLPGSGGYSYFRNSVEKPLTVLMVVVGLVLLIACANVANLLLARAAARQREIAIRLAIGAGRGRLVRQLVLETLVIASLGGLGGMAFAWWGTHVLMDLMPRRGLPIALDVTPDWRILGFAFGLSLLTGLLCGLAPAVAASRPNLTGALKSETAAAARKRFDARRALVAIQVAMSLLLLIGAGLFVRSLRNLQTLDPGFLRERVLLVDVDPSQSGYKGQRLRDYYDRLLERVSALPGVRSASLTEITPLAGSRWNGDASFEGYQWKPTEKPYVDMNVASPRYFETLGIPIILGRDFRPEDDPPFTPDPSDKPRKDDEPLPPPRPVAIINESAAKHFFPNQNPVGRRFTMGDKFRMENTFEIVGVVKDVKYFGVRQPTETMIYYPNWRLGSQQRTLCIRAAGDPERLVAAVRKETSTLDAAIPILQTITLEQQYDNNISQERIVTKLCSFFGGLALLLAAIGLYGVMAHSVARRIREIGIRMALGAQRGTILRLVLRETAWMIAIGALIGLPAAFAATRLVTSFLFGLTAQDPWAMAGSTVVLIAVTTLAGYIPARRATRVDPMVALRYE